MHLKGKILLILGKTKEKLVSSSKVKTELTKKTARTAKRFKTIIPLLCVVTATPQVVQLGARPTAGGGSAGSGEDDHRPVSGAHPASGGTTTSSRTGTRAGAAAGDGGGEGGV